MFTAMINIPGYMPDTDPVDFETCEEAWQYILEELIYDGNLALDSGEDASEYLHAQNVLKSFDMSMPGALYTGNYSYSVDNTSV